MYEVPDFIKKSEAEGFSHFINDAGGSLCELEDQALYQASLRKKSHRLHTNQL